jgi:AbiV family abortive infection protein
MLTSETRALATTLLDGAIKTIKNADELFDEARLLAGEGHVARALLLHQISLEECGKAEILYVSVAEALRGQSVDIKGLVKTFTKHAAKNRTNAYFLPPSEAEVAARARDEPKAAVAAFDELKEAFHHDSNDLKNASLYVDFDGGFKAPSEIITKEDLTEIWNRNGQFMAMAMDKLRLLLRWARNLDAAAEEVNAIWAALGLDTLKRGDPGMLDVFNERLQALLAKAGNKE